MAFATVLMVIAVAAGLYMAWAIGANDVANAMGTSVGSGALTLKRAIIVAAVFEFSGAVLAGGSVSKTIRKGIVEPDAFAGEPQLLVFGMIAALLAAAVWLSIATWRGWPVSTTHSIVGAIVGFSAAGLGVSSVAWGKVGEIVASWVTSPLLAGTLGFLVFGAVRKLVLDHENPMERTRLAAPFLAAATTFVIALVTLWKGLKHLDLHLSQGQAVLVALGVAVVGGLVGAFLTRRVPGAEDDPTDGNQGVERVFALLQIYTACAVAFAHGSNDVANAIGPMAAVVATIKANAVTASSAVPLWMLLVGGVGIVVGLATYGYKVMVTVGEKITHLTPSRGYAAEFAAATTIVLASQLGLPISTTHTLIGGVLGVSLARGKGATNFGIVGQIVVSWIVTLPAGAGLGVGFFFLLKALFGG